MANDHCDSPHGYTHVNISFENHPDIDVEKVIDGLWDTMVDVCEEHMKDLTKCAFEHHESSTGVKCLFPEDGEPMVAHHHEKDCRCADS